MKDEQGFALTTHEAGPGARKVSIYDPSDRLSIYSMVSKKLQEQIDKLPEDVRVLDEDSLRSTVNPSATDNKIRLAFWYAYDHAVSYNQAHFDHIAVVEKICDPYIYWAKVKNKPMLLAWILCPVAAYQDSANEILETGMARLREIMSVSPIALDKQGNKTLNSKIANAQIRIFESLDKRMNGDHVQVIKNINSENADTRQLLNSEEIQRELKKLRMEDDYGSDDD